MQLNQANKTAVTGMWIILWLMIGGCGSTTQRPASLSEAARDASPHALASSYLSVIHTLRWIKAAKEGVNVVMNLDGKTVKLDQSNADAYMTEYERRLATYRQEIEQRGFRNVAGTYTATASGCTNVESMLAPAVQMGMTENIVIVQSDFELELVQTIKRKGEDEGKLSQMKHPGVIVESVIELMDTSNPDFKFHGIVTNGVIELKPDIEVISRTPRPAFLPPLNRKALSECVVQLSSKEH